LKVEDRAIDTDPRGRSQSMMKVNKKVFPLKQSLAIQTLIEPVQVNKPVTCQSKRNPSGILFSPNKKSLKTVVFEA